MDHDASTADTKAQFWLDDKARFALHLADMQIRDDQFWYEQQVQQAKQIAVGCAVVGLFGVAVKVAVPVTILECLEQRLAKYFSNRIS